MGEGVGGGGGRGGAEELIQIFPSNYFKNKKCVDQL